jgi:hypothetical protein
MPPESASADAGGELEGAEKGIADGRRDVHDDRDR